MIAKTDVVKIFAVKIHFKNNNNNNNSNLISKKKKNLFLM